MKKYVVIVMPKKGILDPQGKAIGDVAKRYFNEEIGEIRVGKYFEIMSDKPKEVIEKLAKNILSNEVIEEYKVIEP